MAITENGKFKLPGYQSTFDMYSSIAGAPNFTWAEALHYEPGSIGSFRRPDSEGIVNNILEHAANLQKFREYVDKPFIITSWYRDPDTNRRVGGASRSQHLLGLASDFVIPGMRGHDIAKLAEEFNWLGGIGSYAGFCHLDSRGFRIKWYG